MTAVTTSKLLRRGIKWHNRSRRTQRWQTLRRQNLLSTCCACIFPPGCIHQVWYAWHAFLELLAISILRASLATDPAEERIWHEDVSASTAGCSLTKYRQSVLFIAPTRKNIARFVERVIRFPATATAVRIPFAAALSATRRGLPAAWPA